jgi:hypothetical protein
MEIQSDGMSNFLDRYRGKMGQKRADHRTLNEDIRSVERKNFAMGGREKESR